MSNTLVLVRHGESEWNKLNLFTGWKDVDLSEKGVAEAKKAGCQRTMSASLPGSRLPTSWSRPWAMAGLIVYLAT